MVTSLQERAFKAWEELWKRTGARGDCIRSFELISQAYSERYRFYHNLSHLADCLDKFEPVRRMPKHHNEVEMAIFYHDFIYDTRSVNNERHSAKAALRFCNIHIREEFAQRVYSLIMATMHTEPPPNLDAAVLVDIDLAILGQPQNVYNEYENNIRKEYQCIPFEKFKEERIKILQGFLDRQYIYYTEFFNKKYEAQARQNLQNQLDSLNGVSQNSSNAAKAC